MLEKNKLYKHKYNTDIAFQLLDFEQKDDIIECRVIWWNIQYKFRVDNDTIKIKRTDLHNWSEYNV